MANGNNNSDYTKKHIDLFDLLPEVYKSDTNKAIFKNLFDRFLSKQETRKVAGYIGEGNPNAVIRRQIEESTTHRQAFQLQPILYNKIGTTEHMASWKDIQNELTRLGIDIEQFDEWGELLQFNWVPPISIDKLVHYDEYYWYDEASPNSSPQYITVRNRCTDAQSNVDFWQSLIDLYGSEISIVDVQAVDYNFPTYDVTELDSTADTITISGNATSNIAVGNFVVITNTVSNDGTYRVITSPSYSSSTNTTELSVEPNSVVSDETDVGLLTVNLYDKIVVSGNYTLLFEPNFTFFVSDSDNVEIDGTFIDVVSSEYNSTENTTIIVINTEITNDDATGVISLEEQLTSLLAIRDCRCSGSVGWDLLQWDDNPSSPLWGGAEPGNHADLIAAISHTVDPSGSASQGDLWYNTITDRVYQYDTVSGWVLMWSKFSLVLNNSQGQALWDTAEGCDITTYIPGAEQWAQANKWLHKTNVPNFSIAKQAQFPIIEYDWDLELNEWNYITYNWKYRSEPVADWAIAGNSPSLIELMPIIWWEYDAVNDEIVLGEQYGDLTSWFTVGQGFQVEGLTDEFVVDRSTYMSQAADEPYQTRIKLTTTFASTGLVTGDFANNIPSSTGFHPSVTTNGDPWKGYNEHWLFDGVGDTVPVSHQVLNPLIEIPVTEAYAAYGSPATYNYRSSYYAQEYTVLNDGLTTFELSEAVKSGTYRSLRRRALIGFDDVRVYVNDVRQYGTYDELSEVVVDIISVDTSSNIWTVSGDVSSLTLLAGASITVEGNIGGGNGTYVIDHIVDNLIYVTSSIPSGATAIGTISFSNVTYSDTEIFGASNYVRGVEFLPGYEPSKFDIIKIELGEASMLELGWYSVNVRTIENDAQYASSGNQNISLLKYRKFEQIKNKTNQYPLFDVYNVDGSPANEANALFGFRTDSAEDIVSATGLRMVYDSTNQVFEFDQFLIDEDNGILKAYRDYSNEKQTYWFNPNTNELKVWTGLTWNDKITTSNYYISAYVDTTEPSDYYKNIDGMLWFDTLSRTLWRRDTTLADWVEVSNVNIGTYDTTLQTIWRKGLNNETYVPAKVDWRGRTETEYNEERDSYVTNRVAELLLQSSSLSTSQAETQALSDWYDDQSNNLSSTGVWVGDWEIPDPLYFNNLNENRKYVNSLELITHFDTIIEEQTKIPGFYGSKLNMFHLIGSNDVNYGVGGKIKQFNGGFDTLLSSTFVDNVTPTFLIEFAQDQYESLLNGIKELLRKNAVDYLTDISQSSLIDFASFVASDVITLHEQDDNLSLLYGDSTTFTDVVGSTDIGIRNWIMTLPYLQTNQPIQPEHLIDRDIDLNEVVHHDGHRHNYTFTDAVIETIIQTVVETPDSRTVFLDPLSPTDTFGRSSINLPPNTMLEFETNFNTTILNREGVYWYNTSSNTLYRLSVVSIGTIQPSTSLADGLLWFDTTSGLEVLRIKQTDSVTGTGEWVPADGVIIGDGRLHNGTDSSDVTTSTVSAWVEVNLNEVLGDVILEVENRLYENVPEFDEVKYDSSITRSNDSTLYDQKLYEMFLDYVTQNEIITPLVNTSYSSTDPFTWNYKFSTIGTGFEIVEADSVTNSFAVTGNVVSIFDPCTASAPAYLSCPSTKTFYIKNSGVNDGTWTTLTSTSSIVAAEYDSGNHVTRIYVTEDVTDSALGIIYLGQLPCSTNTGAESGGDWRDFYQKLYGTPYPHLEPWILQGYESKPTWWDVEYLNDDVLKWGSRTWKYKHGFDISGVNITNDYFEIDGDFRELFLVGTTFTVDNSSGVHNGSYTISEINNMSSVTVGSIGSAIIKITGDVTTTFLPDYQFSVISSTNSLVDLLTVSSRTYSSVTNTTSIIVKEAITDATDYTKIGTLYNPSINKTRIYVSQDITDSTVEGRIAVAYGMWKNVRLGLIPAGKTYSNGVVSVTGNPTTDSITYDLPVPTIPTYTYLSVNIDNDWVSSDGGTTKYQPDAVFPPYWNYQGHFGSTPVVFDQPIRSIFYNFNVEIVSPSANYSFGDSGPVEWEWKTSSQYLYDQLSTSFKLDPIQFLFSTFGIDFYQINGLYIDQRSEKTMSHDRTDFHGELIDDTTPYYVNGLNQWYVNYNRYTGYDASFSNFRSLWTQWTAPLMYQFSSFVDVASLGVSHRYVDISENDYNIAAKKSVGVDDYWLDVFDVYVLNMPPKLVRYNNQLDWTLNINTSLDISRSIEYYDVHNYQFYADPDTDVCTLYTWTIQSINVLIKTINIAGDQTNVFVQGREVTISNSTANDGDYTVSSAVYNALTDQTIVEFNETIPSSVVDGVLTANYRSLPWETGDGVYLSTNETLPVPLLGDTVNGLTKYFIYVLSDNTFKLSRTQQNAIDGITIDITTTGRQDHFVGSILNTFEALSGQYTDISWKRYELDTSNVLTFNTPHEIQGIQELINIIFGYEQKKYDDGWRFNYDSSLIDPNTNRLINWQLELERFIQFAYGLRDQQYQNPNRFEVSVDVATDEWTFIDSNTQFITGDKVKLFSSNGVYPSPLNRSISYYIIRDSINEFRLAATKPDAEAGTAINITSIAGVGTLSVYASSEALTASPHQEINPFRNAVWFAPTRGMVSNVVAGSSDDIRTTQNIFDQYGNALTFDKLRVLREDKITTIRVIDNIKNTIEYQVTENPYKYIHLGGMHLMVDSYEHVLKFNNYTSDDVLLYDPFVGLNVTKYEMLFNRNLEFTGRPNLGGYYIETFYNQGLDLNRNIEASVEDLRYLYDTNDVTEASALVTQSRKVLGYDGTQTYLDNININDKSQFLFWKGLIQNKGSRNAINAFINSRRFIDAKVDEFWALKLAEFGSTYEKEFPEMYISTVDARSNDFRMHFVSGSEVADDTFTAITTTDDARWYNQPDQLRILRNNGQNLYFDMKISSSIPITIGTEPPAPYVGDGWISIGSPTTFQRWTGTQWENHGTWVSSDYPIFRHNFESDLVLVTARIYEEGYTQTYTASGSPIYLTIDDYIPATNNIQVFKNGQKLTLGVDYVEVNPVGSNLTSTEIKFNDIIGGTDTIKVVYTTCTLVDGVHYESINTNIIRLLFTDVETVVYDNLKLWGLTLNESAQNPARLLDKSAHVILSNIQLWDPARGVHYSNAIHNMDIQNDSDPAYYGNTPQTQVVPSNTLKIVPWGNEHVGYTWLETHDLDYIPYYDTYAIPNIEDRYRDWGQLSDWGTVDVYEWVRSDVPPSEYNDIAAVEEGDNTIPASERKTGTVRNAIFENVGVNSIEETIKATGTTGTTVDNTDGTGTFTDTNATFIVDDIAVGDWVRISATGSPGVDVGDWRITSVDEEGQLTIATDNLAFSGGSNLTYTIYSPLWEPIINEVEKHDVAITGVNVGTKLYSFTLSTFVENDIINVYVNGTLSQEEVTVPASLTITVSCKEADHVQFVKLAVTDQTTIDAGVADGSLSDGYEYTEETEYDEFGTLQTYYYFWVKNKSTPAVGKNRTMTNNEIVDAIVTLPVPYLFVENPQYANEGVFIEGDKPISRIELQQGEASQTILTTELDIQSGTTVVVVIDNITLTSSDMSLFVDTDNKIKVSLTTPLVGGELIEIRYTGLYDEVVNIPARFNQAIVRGLRGWIDADLRYVIQFVRDFTLRDSLDDGSTSLTLKNKHEEWELFREQQLYNVDRSLWNKVTEAMVGYKLTNNAIRVPSYERELYDEKYGTSTRYGLGDGQAFVDGDIAHDTILADLENAENDFQPIDINVFFTQHNFDTDENIVEAMNTIYNTFSYEHVNRMAFAVLHDAFSLKTEYEGIFKTSMISLNGIKPLQAAGQIFDD